MALKYIGNRDQVKIPASGWLTADFQKDIARWNDENSHSRSSLARSIDGGLCPVMENRKARARRVERDVKAVHADITALLNAGVVDRAEGGGIVFPFEAVKVEFLLEAA